MVLLGVLLIAVAGVALLAIVALRRRCWVCSAWIIRSHRACPSCWAPRHPPARRQPARH